jgi:hypothetical protein
LLFPDAGPSHLLWVGRIFTVVIGLGITVGAMYVGGVGGAFEANKLFTGILAIPLAVPLLLGLLMRRPTSLSLILSIVVGSGLALILNFWQPIQAWLTSGLGLASDSVFARLAPLSWESATLVTVAVSVAVFAATGVLQRRTPAKQADVDGFFEKLRTPLLPEQIPSISPAVRKRLALLFGGSFVIVGLLYVGVSLVSIFEYSGIVGTIAGGACVVCGCATCLLTLRKTQEEERSV